MSTDNPTQSLKLDEVVAATIAQLPAQLHAEYLQRVTNQLRSAERVFLDRAGKSQRGRIRAAITDTLPSLQRGVAYRPITISRMLPQQWHVGSVERALEYVATQEDTDLYSSGKYHYPRTFFRPEETEGITRDELVAGVQTRIDAFSAKEIREKEKYRRGQDYYEVVPHTGTLTRTEKRRDEKRREALRWLFSEYVTALDHNLHGTGIPEEVFTFRGDTVEKIITPRVNTAQYFTKGMVSIEDIEQDFARYISNSPREGWSINYEMIWDNPGVIAQEESHFYARLGIQHRSEKRVYIRESVDHLMELLGNFVIAELKPQVTYRGKPYLVCNPPVLAEQKRITAEKKRTQIEYDY